MDELRSQLGVLASVLETVRDKLLDESEDNKAIKERCAQLYKERQQFKNRVRELEREKTN